MSQPGREYQQHIHVFRGIAICLIVCAHTLPSLNWSGDPLLGRIIDGIANQSSIYFFFIAGYLFQHLSGRFDYRRYLEQKLKTVIAPYLILSAPAIYIFTCVTPRLGMFTGFYDLPVWQQVVVFLLTGKHLTPLWFVPTIALYYLAAPLLVWMDRRLPRFYWVIVPLLVLSSWMGRGGKLGPLNFALYLLPVYLLGMAFSRYRERALELVARWWLPLLAVAAVSMYVWVLMPQSATHTQIPQKVAMALLITWLLSRHHGVIEHRLDYVADVSFGIFFIHAYFISVIKVVTIYLMEHRVYRGDEGDAIVGNFWTFILYAGSVLLLSVATLWLSRRVLGRHSRMIVGA